jgi:peptidoglycan hydrolase-like protein with peptidoglycan-binding domain
LTCGWSLLAPVAGADARFMRFGDRSLEEGDRGRDVRVLQRWLTRIGVQTRADGTFGGRTARSVRHYERRFAMTVDGRVSRLQARGLRVRAFAATAHSTALTSVSPAVLAPDGRTAIAPAAAPAPVQLAIAAANALTDKPYRYGGGHGSFEDSAYDCSGAVSYVLHAAGLLEAPRDSTGLMRFGAPGPGTWMTTYAHADHAYIVIAGLRFDTSGRGEEGPRWRVEPRSRRRYTARHPAGL